MAPKASVSWQLKKRHTRNVSGCIAREPLLWKIEWVQPLFRASANSQDMDRIAFNCEHGTVRLARSRSNQLIPQLNLEIAVLVRKGMALWKQIKFLQLLKDRVKPALGLLSRIFPGPPFRVSLNVTLCK